MSTAEIAARRAAACRSFWSDDPLNVAYRQETGAQSFTLRDFIAYVIELPSRQFEQLAH